MATQATLEYLIKVNDRDLKELKSRITETNKALGEDTESAANRGEAAFNKVGAAAVRGSKIAVLGIGGLAAAAINAAGDYQASLNTFEAVSGATGQQMGKIGKLAIQLGNDVKLPATSAKDAADAMTELAKSGLSVQDIMKSTRGVLVLSAAAQVDNARAAEITANALNTFRLKGDKAVDVADQLAATANASSVEINDVADAMKMAGAVFSSFQSPVLGAKGAMTELNTAIGLLGNAGIKGSDAGTSLKQALLQLAAPASKTKNLMRDLYLASGQNAKAQDLLTLSVHGATKEIRDNAQGALEDMYGATKGVGDIAFDSSGKMRSLPEIIKQMAEATKGMTDEEKDYAVSTIFGADATRSILALMQAGPKDWDKMSSAVTRQGAAQDVAASKMKGFKGQMEIFRSTVETLAITFGETLLPAATKVMSFLATSFATFGSHKTATLVLVAALGSMAAMVLTVNAAIKVVRAATTAYTAAQWLLNAAMSANPIALVVIALAAIAAALVVAYEKSDTFRRIVNGAWDTLKGFGEWIGKVGVKAGQLLEEMFRVTPLGVLVTHLGDMWNALKDVYAWITKNGKTIAGAFDAAFGPVKDIFSDILGYIQKIQNGIEWLLKKIPSIHIPSIHIPGIGDGVASVGPGGKVQLPPSLAGDPSINSGLWDDIALGRQNGLVVTSGYRGGAITSTGNHSLHSVYPSKAVDMGGSEAAMRQFFLQEIGREGIAELIHSPYWWHPGAGVQLIPASAGTVLKDHYNHVHVGIYHGGGVVPGSGESLAVLRGGEGVFTPEQMAAMGGGRIDLHNHIYIDGEELSYIIRDEIAEIAKYNVTSGV